MSELSLWRCHCLTSRHLVAAQLGDRTLFLFTFYYYSSQWEGEWSIPVQSNHGYSFEIPFPVLCVITTPQINNIASHNEIIITKRENIYHSDIKIFILWIFTADALTYQSTDGNINSNDDILRSMEQAQLYIMQQSVSCFDSPNILPEKRPMRIKSL